MDLIVLIVLAAAVIGLLGLLYRWLRAGSYSE